MSYFRLLLLRLLLLVCCVLSGCISCLHSTQNVSICQKEHQQLQLSSTWKAIGPFPAGMREHQTGALPVLALHPLHTLFNTSHPIQLPSTFGKEGGFITAKEVHSSSICHDTSEPSSRLLQQIHLSYPNLDWSLMRKSTGWAGLQWQALLLSDLRVEGNSMVTIGINLASGADFTIISGEEYGRHTWDDPSYHTKWYNGDWYGYSADSTLTGADLPMHIIKLDPGDYKILIKKVYEIRIFGDVEDSSPSMDFQLYMTIIDTEEHLGLRAITIPPYGVVPDVLNGQFAGWGVSFALINSGHFPIEIIEMKILGEAAKYLQGDYKNSPLRIESLQQRPVKLRVHNKKSLPSSVNSLEIQVTYRRTCHPSTTLSTTFLHVILPLRHISNQGSVTFSVDRVAKQKQSVFQFSGDERSATNKDHCLAYTYTYLDSDQTVQYASAIPPKRISAKGDEERMSRPLVLYLHGAGAGVEGCSLLQQNQSWVIQPMGRSSWGYDWQILSHTSATRAIEAFATNLYGLSGTEKRKADGLDTSKIMVTGHSNGGQGVYHYVSHRPDQTIGAIVGAGYISLNEYVPMTWQLGRHYIDASLNGILRSSLNAFENNLFASNLAGIPLLLKYGSIDDNVPTWHSREMFGLMTSWNEYSRAPEGLLKISEVFNKSHHWPTFMKEKDVQNAIEAQIESSLNPGYQMPTPLARLTLTVFNPEDSESKQGWNIIQVEVPGRMARVEVEYLEGRVDIKTSYVAAFQLETSSRQAEQGGVNSWQSMVIDGTEIDFASDLSFEGVGGVIYFKKSKEAGWKVSKGIEAMRPMGPMIRFLSSSGPIHIIVPTNCSAQTTQHYHSIALRFSTDAYVYGRLDTVILQDYEAVGGEENDGSGLLSTSSNILLLGGPTLNAMTRMVMSAEEEERDDSNIAATASFQQVIQFVPGSSQFKIRDRIFSKRNSLLTLLPLPKRPSNQTTAPLALLFHGTDALAIERGYSLLPVRTGTLLPEWMVMDHGASMWKGYGAVVGAGWFDSTWSWSEAMSYLV